VVSKRRKHQNSFGHSCVRAPHLFLQHIMQSLPPLFCHRLDLRLRRLSQRIVLEPVLSSSISDTNKTQKRISNNIAYRAFFFAASPQPCTSAWLEALSRTYASPQQKAPVRKAELQPAERAHAPKRESYLAAPLHRAIVADEFFSAKETRSARWIRRTC
jgi:hypothetical protein